MFISIGLFCNKKNHKCMHEANEILLTKSNSYFFFSQCQVFKIAIALLDLHISPYIYDYALQKLKLCAACRVN